MYDIEKITLLIMWQALDCCGNDTINNYVYINVSVYITDCLQARMLHLYSITVMEDSVIYTSILWQYSCLVYSVVIIEQ